MRSSQAARSKKQREGGGGGYTFIELCIHLGRSHTVPSLKKRKSQARRKGGL